MSTKAPTINLQPVIDQIQLLEKQKKSLVPTPPVGTNVIWYKRADVRAGNDRAAIVTLVESPGKLSLTVFGPQSMPSHVKAVLHSSDPTHERRNNHLSVTNGAWDYPAGVKIPKEHYKMDEERLDYKIAALTRQLDEAEAIKNKNDAGDFSGNPFEAETTE